METTAEKLALLKATKANLKAALTEQGQTPGDVMEAYPDMVRAIKTGVTLPQLTAPGAAADLRKGKQLIDQEGKVVDGTLVEVEQATPIISVNASGLITATASDKSATKQLPIMSGRVVTPSASEQLAVGTGVYTTGPIYVQGDGNLRPENIVSGVSIFNVTGTASGGGGYHTSNSGSSSLAEIDASGKLVIQPPTDIDITTISGVENFGVRIYKGDVANLEYREMLIVNYLSDLFNARYLHTFWSGASNPQNAKATLEEIVHSYCTIDFNETTKVLTITPSNEMSLLDYGDPNIHIRVTYALH